jgi:hypothetical protein
MDWQQALRARLLADGPLTTLVSTRVHWSEFPQGVVGGRVLLRLVADTRDQHLKGFHGMQPARVQIDSYGDDYAQVVAITEAVIAAAVPGQWSNGHDFARAMVTLPPRDASERVTANDGTSKTVFRVSMDLTFNHAANEEGS